MLLGSTAHVLIVCLWTEYRDIRRYVAYDHCSHVNHRTDGSESPYLYHHHAYGSVSPYLYHRDLCDSFYL